MPNIHLELCEKINELELRSQELFKGLKKEIEYQNDDFKSLFKDLEKIEEQLDLLIKFLDAMAKKSEQVGNETYTKISSIYLKFRELNNVYFNFNHLKEIIRFSETLSNIKQETWDNLEKLITIFKKNN